MVALLALNLEEEGQKHETQHKVITVAQVRGSGGLRPGGSSGGGEDWSSSRHIGRFVDRLDVMCETKIGIKMTSKILT